MNNKEQNKQTEKQQQAIRARNAVNAVIFAAQFGKYDASRDGLARRNLGPEVKIDIPESYIRDFGTGAE